jgi:alpha-beta hydrolase superfamily lysophospholipase
MLAEGLAKNGIATLRYDKRGIAKSASAMTSESDLRFETYVKDVIDWVSLLKADKRFSKIILLGHSEGSLIGMLAAQKSSVSGYISVAGVGKTADEVLREQIKGKLPPQAIIESNRILDSLKKGVQLYPTSMNMNALFRPSVQPYMISWIKYNPSKEISKLKIPVLIIQGTTDLQVSAEHAKLLQAGKPAAKLKIFENMNHILKESSSNPIDNQATYKNPILPLKAGLIDEISAFVKSAK